jgi:hypothetical protein
MGPDLGPGDLVVLGPGTAREYVGVPVEIVRVVYDLRPQLHFRWGATGLRIAYLGQIDWDETYALREGDDVPL